MGKRERRKAAQGHRVAVSILSTLRDMPSHGDFDIGDDELWVMWEDACKEVGQLTAFLWQRSRKKK